MNKNIPVTMICEDLNSIPQFNLDPLYSFRWFLPGDEKIWQLIQAKADQYNEITNQLFAAEFGADLDLIGERQGYIIESDYNAIATGTAWFDDNYKGQQYGRIHWVAINPEMQGRGLAKPLMTIICNRLKQLGHSRAYLTTASARIPAINLYLKFGFTPVFGKELDSGLWEEIGKEISEYDRKKRNPDI